MSATAEQSLERAAAALEGLTKLVRERIEAAERKLAAERHDEYVHELEQRQHPLHRISTLTILRAVPGLASQFKRVVPPRLWRHVADGAQVDCPCGEKPTIEAERFGDCECGRYYLFTGEQLRVRPIGGPDA